MKLLAALTLIVAIIALNSISTSVPKRSQASGTYVRRYFQWQKGGRRLRIIPCFVNIQMQITKALPLM